MTEYVCYDLLVNTQLVRVLAVDRAYTSQHDALVYCICIPFARIAVISGLLCGCE